MAVTYHHRAYDPVDEAYRYWYSDLPYDSAGVDYPDQGVVGRFVGFSVIGELSIVDPSQVFMPAESVEDTPLISYEAI